MQFALIVLLSSYIPVNILFHEVNIFILDLRFSFFTILKLLSFWKTEANHILDWGHRILITPKEAMLTEGLIIDVHLFNA